MYLCNVVRGNSASNGMILSHIPKQWPNVWSEIRVSKRGEDGENSQITPATRKKVAISETSEARFKLAVCKRSV